METKCHVCGMVKDDRGYLTPKETEIMKYIQEYIEENSISPSFREIMMGVNLKSTSSVDRYLFQLQAKQYLFVKNAKWRSIKILQRIT
jgi:SOS-response transcriptional repressor LexA